jgi:hypothetical protein
MSQAAVITYKDGIADPFTGTMYEGTEDTTIECVSISWVGTNSNQNYGGREYIAVGRNVRFGFYGPQRSLLRFDIESLVGKYSNINSVTLRLYPSEVYLYGQTSNTVSAYLLSPANSGWVEGSEFETDLGEPPDIGMVTWNSRIEGSESWEGSVGASTPGVDFDPTVLASSIFAGDTPLDTAYDLVITGQNAEDLIEQWLTGANSGIMLMSGNDTYHSDTTILRLWSTESSYPEYYPEIIIDYDPISGPVSEPSTFILLLSGLVLLAGRMRKRKSN